MIDINVFFFGSPGDGYEAFPNKYKDIVSSLSSSGNIAGSVDSKYLKNNNYTLAYYIIHGLLSPGDHSIRGGSPFGIGIKLDGIELSSEGINKLFSFLEEAVNRGLHQPSVGIFRQENDKSIKRYSIKNFHQKEKELEVMIDRFMDNFRAEFNKHIIDITNSSPFSIELNPEILRQNIKVVDKNKGEMVHNPINKVAPTKVRENTQDKNYLTLMSMRKFMFRWLMALTLLLIGSLGCLVYQFMEIKELKASITSDKVSLENIKKETNRIKSDIVPQGDAYTNVDSDGGVSKYYLNIDAIKSKAHNRKIDKVDDLLEFISGVLLENSKNIKSIYNTKTSLIKAIKEYNSKDINNLSNMVNNKGIDTTIDKLLDTVGDNFLIYQK